MGAYLDRYLLFDVHINEMKRKVMVILIYVSRISDNLDNYSRIMVIQAIALSLINYCIRIWGTTNDTLMSSVQKLQDFAVRVAMGGVKKYDHVSQFYKRTPMVTCKAETCFRSGYNNI